MSKWHRGRVTLDEIDQPVTIGRTVFRVVGTVEIEVEACDESRDYTVDECDLSLMFGDFEVCNVRDWAGIGDEIRKAIVPRLEQACVDCECTEQVERIKPVSMATTSNGQGGGE